MTVPAHDTNVSYLTRLRERTDMNMLRVGLRVARVRPAAGVALPRPCDPTPGHFIEQMLAKQHALWLGGIRDVVGYDSRFLLPATCEQANVLREAA